MERNYRITIITDDKVIERSYWTKNAAINAVIAYRKDFDNFKIGIVSEAIEGRWYNVFSLMQ